MSKCDELMEEFKNRFPLNYEKNKELFDDVCHHCVIMHDVSEKLGIPTEELLSFFNKGRIKLERIEKIEKELENNGNQEEPIL